MRVRAVSKPHLPSRWMAIAVWASAIGIASCAARPPAMDAGGRAATVWDQLSGESAAFVGAWRLALQEGRDLRADTLVPTLTSAAWPGLLVYSPDGWMSVTIDRRATGGTYWGYFGTFHAGAGDTIVHTLLGGVPRGRGPSPARYRFEARGTRLVITTLPGADSVVVRYIFERAGSAPTGR